MRSVVFLSFLACFIQSAPVPDADVMDYLSKYGYIQPSKLSSNGNKKSQQDIRRDGLKELQASLGLEKTGNLNEETIEQMEKPRCAMQYRIPAALTAGDIPRINYVTKWPKKELTYKLAKQSGKISKGETKKALAAGFKLWEDVSQLKFVEVPSFIEKADVKVKFFKLEHGDNLDFDGQGDKLAHASFPTEGRLHIDDDENFLFSDYSKLSKSKPFNYVDLLYVVAHEGGHLLGLDHSPNNASIMYPTYTPKFDSDGNYILPKLGKVDIEAIQQMYGKNEQQELNLMPSSQPTTTPRVTSSTTASPELVQNISSKSQKDNNGTTAKPEGSGVGAKAGKVIDGFFGKVNGFLHSLGLD